MTATPTMRSNTAITLRLQSVRTVGRVAKLGSLASMKP